MVTVTTPNQPRRHHMAKKAARADNPPKPATRGRKAVDRTQKSMWFSDEEIQWIESIRKHYGLSNDAEVIRFALRSELRRIEAGHA